MRNEDLLKGAALGVGVALLVPVAMIALAPVIRPLARTALKSGLMVYEKGRETLEELGETFDDVRAEVEEELTEERTGEAVAEAVDETVKAASDK
jgi:hypothetical protein